MKNKFIFTFCIFLFLLAGCAKPPVAEMENAKEAVFRAENDADAVLYAGSALAQARDALNRMQVEVDSKRYDSAKTFAIEAADAANRAIADGKTGAKRVKDEADVFLSSLRQSIEETAKNINNARNSRLALDFNALNSDLTKARDTTDQAEVAQVMGRYQEALDKGRDVRSILGGINERLTNAATASSAKK